MTREIRLSRGGATRVDDCDHEELCKYRWRVSLQGYVVRSEPRPSTALVLMHRQILHCPSGLVVDHINGDKLDNRRINLRVVTVSENLHNHHAPARSSTGHRNIYLRVDNKPRPYLVASKEMRKEIVVGWFSTLSEALVARDKYEELMGRAPIFPMGGGLVIVDSSFSENVGREEEVFSPPSEALLGYTNPGAASTADVGNSYPQPPVAGFLEVQRVEGVVCPRCGRETHPDTIDRPCRGNHYWPGLEAE